MDRDAPFGVVVANVVVALRPGAAVKCGGWSLCRHFQVNSGELVRQHRREHRPHRAAGFLAVGIPTMSIWKHLRAILLLPGMVTVVIPAVILIDSAFKLLTNS